MNLSEAIDQIQTHMGFRSDLTVRATAALKVAQDQLERGPAYPWFLISEDSQIVTQVGERRLPLPSDFIGEYEQDEMTYIPAVGEPIELIKGQLDVIKATVEDSAVGPPEFYARVGNYFVLYPKPDDFYVVKMRYYAKDVAISSLSSTQTNKWLTYAPDAIIGKAGLMLATGTRDLVAIQAFTSMESLGRTVLNVQNTEQEISNESLQMGGPH